MKRLALTVVALSFVLMCQNAFAYISLPDYGETGWQTFTHYFDAPWTGKVGVLSSNAGDTSLSSVLLVDKLNRGPSGNTGFELNNLTGYTPLDLSDVTVVSSFASYAGTVYSPTEGSYMARLLAAGTDTSAYGGTNGAILWMTDDISFNTGETFSFDWNFLAFDHVPFNDFAMVLHTGDTYGDSDMLAKIEIAQNPVPEPASLSLLGLGLFGLLGFRKRIK